MIVKKKGIGIESEKIWKKVRGQKVWKQIREWKEVKDGAQGLLYLEWNSNNYPYSDCYLINHYKTDAVRIGRVNALAR